MVVTAPPPIVDVDHSGIFPGKAVKRIIVIADLHGDMVATIDSFKLANVITLNGTRWVWSASPGTVVVQLGDQIDRLSREEDGGDEDSEVKILKFVDYLDAQAKVRGSRVLALNGNHEFMSVRAHVEPQNLSYVSPKGLQHFGGAQGRIDAFKPGGEMGVYLGKNRYSVLKVGKFLFAHGGVLPKIAEKYTIPQINRMGRDYLLGKLVWNRDLHELVESPTGIMWTRAFSGPRPCGEKLNAVLKKWECDAMFLGHTPQENGISSACNHRVWRCDCALSRSFGSKGARDRLQILEISCMSDGKYKFSPLSFANQSIVLNRKSMDQCTMPSRQVSPRRSPSPPRSPRIVSPPVSPAPIRRTSPPAKTPAPKSPPTSQSTTPVRSAPTSRSTTPVRSTTPTSRSTTPVRFTPTTSRPTSRSTTPTMSRPAPVPADAQGSLQFAPVR